jgi:hypothetical protein
MSAQATSTLKTERRKPEVKNPPKSYGWELYLIIVTLAMIGGFFISKDGWYKAGDNIGYNIGLVGGIMMLTLLIYPARKRLGFMKDWGLLPKWFKWHMIFGILGPALVVFHSTFIIRSYNAGVALVCMLLVSGSGIFGRFFYTKIHNGLYGRQASHKQLQAALDGSGDVKSILGFAPAIQQLLNEFRESTLQSSGEGKLNLLNSITVEIRAKSTFREMEQHLEMAMYAGAQVRGLNNVQRKRLDEMFAQNRAFVRAYIMAVRDLAQFSTYEKLFSYWHIFHVPIVYMLVFSSIWHVVSVHQY